MFINSMKTPSSYSLSYKFLDMVGGEFMLINCKLDDAHF